ncbi:MAG TPA: hypothetical protein PLI51_04680 [bacterium]|nr:hypothetical protein [bacterium]HPQ66006.1 hypothetical protein [bacterium]
MPGNRTLLKIYLPTLIVWAGLAVALCYVLVFWWARTAKTPYIMYCLLGRPLGLEGMFLRASPFAVTLIIYAFFCSLWCRLRQGVRIAMWAVLTVGGLTAARESLLVFRMADFIKRASQPPQYLEHIVAPDGKRQFVLYTDRVGIDDETWYVLKIDSDVDPTTLRIPRGFVNAGTPEEKEWAQRTLFWNWTEAGHHRRDPHLKLVKDRYLIFVRGGLNHALYDLETDRVLIEDGSPWHSLVHSPEYRSLNPEPGRKAMAALMDDWVRKNLHGPIEEIVKGE